MKLNQPGYALIDGDGDIVTFLNDPPDGFNAYRIIKLTPRGYRAMRVRVVLEDGECHKCRGFGKIPEPINVSAIGDAVSPFVNLIMCPVCGGKK